MGTKARESKQESQPACRRDASEGFAPIAGPCAEWLVLGSLPGVASIDAGQYYAHPRNAFWRIMDDLLDVRGSYDRRARQLAARHVAVWDVLQASVRPGSLDSNIRLDTAVANDFAGFFLKQPRLRRIGFNGRTAEQLFRRLVLPGVDLGTAQLVSLPSTSPAYAGMPYAEKRRRWRQFLDNSGDDKNEAKR